MVFYILLSAEFAIQKRSYLNISKVFVAERLLGCYPVLGVELEHALDYLQPLQRNQGQQVFEVLLPPLGERGLGVR
jgi:hypothetical protein